MKKKIIYIFAISLAFSSCGFLDKEPDNRTTITTYEQVKKLLTTAYSAADYGFICEWSSDNIVDNHSEDGTWLRYPTTGTEYGVAESEIFAWEPANSLSAGYGDSPVSIWENAYKAIGVANHALVAMDEIIAAGSTDDFSGARAEAYLCRAYNHFVLANVFCMPYRDSVLSMSDLGVPYVTEPERTVYSNAERGTLTELYNKIEQDMLAGLKDVTDAYDQPKYHFNKQAAYAFATRFYLFKRDYDKVIHYATLALGDNPMGCMRTGFWSNTYTTTEQMLFAYSSTTSPNNFLLTTTSSAYGMRGLCQRYSVNRQASRASIYGPGPTWNDNYPECYSRTSSLYYRTRQEYGLYFMHVGEYFEFTDKVAGIGFAHNVNPTFTGEETLLCRAEAYIMKNDFTNALADLKVWDESRKAGQTTGVFIDLTESIIESFYNYQSTGGPTIEGTVVPRCPAFHCSDLCPDWVITDKQKKWLDCVLHFRRLETIHEGMRWFDIKRFGIEVTHTQYISDEDKGHKHVLTWNDPRRAIQIPITVIQAGITANPRESASGSGSELQRYDGSAIVNYQTK